MKASAPDGPQEAEYTIPSRAASCRGLPPRAGIDHTSGYSSRTPGSTSATNPIRPPLGCQNACVTSNAGGVSLPAPAPDADIVHKLVNWSRNPAPSNRHV